jgi:hypothetical protein
VVRTVKERQTSRRTHSLLSIEPGRDSSRQWEKSQQVGGTHFLSGTEPWKNQDRERKTARKGHSPPCQAQSQGIIRTAKESQPRRGNGR